jgi:hypothetical protein
MKTKYKYILLGIVGLLLLALVLIIGLRTLVMSIANQRTCEWANIDNIEINARIDVPSIIDSDCEYLEVINTKKAYFEFDLADFDADRYIEVNKLKRLNSKYFEIDFINFNIYSLKFDMLYYKSRNGKNFNSYALFDKNKGQLWVSIQYFD